MRRGSMVCTECGALMRETRERLFERYKGEEFEILGIRHFVCDECGNIELVAEDADKLSGAVADARHGLPPLASFSTEIGG